MQWVRGGGEEISLRLLNCENVKILNLASTTNYAFHSFFHVKSHSHLIKSHLAASKTKRCFLRSEMLPSMEDSLLTRLEKWVFHLDCLCHLTANIILEI